MNSVSSTAENQKVFSIIIATFNCGQKIEKTLQSIFAQNKELFEVIILDNESAPETLEYLEKYKNELTLISEKDQGIYDAFNKGIELATGKYIYFIGAGDALKPDILEKIKNDLPTEIPSFVYGKSYFSKRKTVNGREFYSKLFIRDNICQQGIFYHRDVFKLIGKFDLRYKVLSDWLFNLKCFLCEDITKHYLDYVIADYEEGGVSNEITCDPVFLKDFPVFVRKEFGLSNYLICKAFLREPYVFNYIYNRHFYLLTIHLINKSAILKKLASYLKPFVRASQESKKIIKDKN